MSNQINDEIAERIAEETDKIHFIREGEKEEYAKIWYDAMIESDQSDIFAVQPKIFTMQPATDEWLENQENKFINSFTE
ncbi:MAG: hypothetical protein WC389_21665 [Lutibacter sp.]|jgi:hypothetical protein